MSPLLLANWREINRVFCTIVWIVALVLMLVVVGRLAGGSAGCVSNPSSRVAECHNGSRLRGVRPEHPQDRRGARPQASENGG